VDEYLRGHHHQRGGHALVGHVRDQQRQVVVVDQEEVVKIAAPFEYMLTYFFFDMCLTV